MRSRAPARLCHLIEEQLEGFDVGICLDYGHAHLMGDLGEAIEDGLRPSLDDARPRQRRRSATITSCRLPGRIDWDAAMM